ncbi:MAG: hypothetical protein S4CHLAM81_11590 [Chlamydiales bacterium]|nr:hypothetical protein [Chlamydiales bacterium]MCH9635936.1 hypothetical protein [Chlamydiales bacterium]
MQPFVRQVTATKAATLLLKSVTSNDRFEQLPQEEQLELLKGQESLQKGTFRPLVTKFRLEGSGVIWALLSIIICLFLLLHIEGAHLACWLLPVTIVIYAFSLNRAPPLKGEQIFPKEQTIEARFLEEGESFENKNERLVTAWNRYLIHDWAKETPSEDLAVHAQQLEVAVFNFNVQRAFWVLHKRGEDAVVAHLLFHPPLVLLIAYFIWNVVFAWRISRFEALYRRNARAAM